MKNRPLVQKSLLCSAVIGGAFWSVHSSQPGLPAPKAAEATQQVVSLNPVVPPPAPVAPALTLEKWPGSALDFLVSATSVAREISQNPPAPPAPAPPVDPLASVPIPDGSTGHVILLSAGKTVRLRGEVRTVFMQERLLEKARLAYADREVVSEIRVTESLVKPFEGIDLTLRSFPTLPQAQAPGLLGMAVVGQPWQHCSVPADGVNLETLSGLSLFPQEFDRTRAMVDFAQIMPVLKQHVDSLPLPKTASRDP